jgi:polysaccharide pyruvyl transferase WcaK-like protein
VTTTPRIAIMGHVGNGNLGDEAIIAAVIARLRARAPGVDLVAFTSNVPDTTERHGIPAFPIRLLGERDRGAEVQAGGEGLIAAAAARVRRVPRIKALLRPLVLFARSVVTVVRECGFDLRSYRRLRGVRLVVFAGSGQLNDDMDGPFGYPLTILRWCVLTRLRGAAVGVASIGAGPLESPLSRWFLRRALRLASYRSFRDPSSLALARRVGAPEPNLLVRDLAFSHPGLAADASAAPSAPAKCVGINPLPFYGGSYWMVQDRSVYDGYVAAHAELSLGLIRRGWRVVLFPTQLRADPDTIRDILQRLREVAPAEAGAVESATELTDVPDLLGLLATFDLVVATRYHGVLLALASAVPTVAVSYHPKTRDVMEHMGLAAWCLEVEGLTGSVLLDRVERMGTQLAQVRAALLEQRGRDLGELLDQYDALLRLAGAAVRAEGRGGAALATRRA